MTRVRAVIQSRLSSSRLPGKAMMTIGGLPLIELAARRASRERHEVVVATSVEPEDDLIADHLARVGLRAVRGPLDDVLGRFVEAADGLDGDDVVVRLTGDNPLADADLVDEIVAAMTASGRPYARVDIAQVPEGIGAEAFTADALRAAAKDATSDYDREHVTPWLRRTYGDVNLVPVAAPRETRVLRATIDVLDDYQRVARIFGHHADPVAVAWPLLMTELEAMRDATLPILPLRGPAGREHSAAVLDAGRLAVRLRAARRPGRPEQVVLRRMLAMALATGVTHVTSGRGDVGAAPALRGALEPALLERIGVVANVPALAVDDGDSGRVAALAVEAAVERTLRLLGRSRISALVLDSPADAFAGEAAAWERLLRYADDRAGTVAGVAASTDAEVRQALALPRLGYLELADGALLEAVGDGVPDGLVVVAAGDAALLRQPGGAAVLDAVLVGGETEDDVRSALVGAARAGEPR